MVDAGSLDKLSKEPAWEMRRAPTSSPVNDKMLQVTNTMILYKKERRTFSKHANHNICNWC